MMFKKFIPYCHANSIYEIKPSFFSNNGFNVVFIDLDNTLDSYKAKEPKQKTIDYINSLKEENIVPIIISNNKPKRVYKYAEMLGIDYLASARKPFSKRIKREIEKRKIDKNHVILVGDQMMTDVLAGYNAKIKVVLTEKIVKEDQWTTHFNRLIDRPIRKYHLKHKNLRDWRTL